ncbi:MAG: hypothetical protein A2Z99_21020 [Treponema sp. GWB1_62_6]|nr:MAG: hypothetical protein A2Z99_21020 [Treponema sp. GWB1_62_6]OHE63175.1 MAG: hypothetical protein A2Y36_01430 [Treponema sp. GWA1_62_8]HCM26432.1 hypothetical protein [Treponema sp.]
MTIHEIARESGVSIATVSRVLNKGPVSKEKRNLVEAAIRRLNYIPDDLTRRNLGAPSKAVAVLTHSMTNFFSMEFAETVIARYGDAGTIVYLCRNDTGEAEYRCLADLMARGIDGIILHDPPLDNFESGLFAKMAQRVPLVVVHSFPEAYELNAVVVDQNIGMKKVMAHLLELGHRDILFLRNPYGFSFDLKEKVWREELTAAGSPPPDENVLSLPDTDREIGIERTEDALTALLETGRRPTAIFAANDIIGVGALNAVRRAGLRVPEDISIMSHDNTILASSYRLSSVDLKIRSLAHAAVDLMTYATEGFDKEPRRIMITPELVLRDSTGPARPA